MSDDLTPGLRCALALLDAQLADKLHLQGLCEATPVLRSAADRFEDQVAALTSLRRQLVAALEMAP